jgi:hypothetical protein
LKAPLIHFPRIKPWILIFGLTGITAILVTAYMNAFQTIHHELTNATFSDEKVIELYWSGCPVNSGTPSPLPSEVKDAD